MQKKQTLIIMIMLIPFLVVACNQNNSISQMQIEDVVSDPKYMKECLEINPKRLAEQVGYENILPGITEKEKVVSLFGDPNEIYHGTETEDWYYADFNLRIKENIVIGLVLTNDEKISTLRKYIGSYGCPNAIIKTVPSEELPESFIFVFNQIGLEMTFAATQRIRLDEKPKSVHYIPPSTLEEYFKNDLLLSNPYFVEVIPWKKVVH